MNRKISLDTGWKLRYEELNVEKLDPLKLIIMDDRWMEVNLPCDVHMPLIERGIIPEPTVGIGYQDSAWIEEKSWWFYRELIVEEDMLLNNNRLFIVLEQLDSNAQIWINDQLVGEQKSVHYPFRKDIKFDLRAGNNTILIRVTTGFEGIDDNRIQSLEGTVLPNGGREDARRAFLRKPQFTCGWDWAPRLLTCGMNGNAYLLEEQSVVVRDVHVVTTQIEPIAELNISIHIDNLNLIATQEVRMKVSVLYDNQEVYTRESEHNIRAGSNYFTNVAKIENPLLWWPNGYGDQPLYDLRVEVIGDHSEDVLCTRFGIRTIVLDDSRIDQDNRLFAFKVNNQRIFSKGANWVPSDIIYARVMDQKYEALLKAAKDQNFTMLRIWGGGLFEKDVFYDLCNQYGILVWQDFMYACSIYPETEQWFMDESEREAIYQVKRLRNHPCLALWCGNNEMYWVYGEESYKLSERGMKRELHTIYNYMLPDIINKYHKGAIYWNSSPYGGVVATSENMGDNHIWQCWRYPNPMYESHEIYDLRETKFMSEYGYIGPCVRSSIDDYCGSVADHQMNDLYRAHSHYLNDDYKKSMVYKAISQHYGDHVVRDFEDYLLYGQLAQGHLLEYSLLAYRSKENCYGALYWMYNDAWGEEGWTTIDYYLRKKPSYYYVKRALEPLKFILKRDGSHVNIIAINEAGSFVPVIIEVGRQDYFGNKVTKQTLSITLDPRSRGIIYNMPHVTESSDLLYYVKLIESTHPTTVCSEILMDHYFKQLVQIDPQLSYRVEQFDKDLKITIETKYYAHAVNIKLPVYKEFSDNFFDMLPGDKKDVYIYDCGDIQMNDIYVKSIINKKEISRY